MANERIIIIDLDGTLIFTDMLYESAKYAIKENFFVIFLMIFWLLKGKANLKCKLSNLYEFDPKNLPYNEDLIDLIYRKKQQGFYIVLCTATCNNIAKKISGYLKLFDRTIASSSIKNLSGKNKAKAIISIFHKKNFCYAGNSWSDIHIWKISKSAILIKPSFLLELYARKSFKIEKIFN